MMDFQYHVIEFQESPHASVPRFVCIPTSWMRTKPSPDRKTAVAFPEEQFLATVGRIISGEQFNVNWRIHIVNVILGCENLNDGQKYAVEQCAAYAAQKNVQTNQNDQFCKPVKAAKRAAKRSMSVDACYSNKRSKLPKIQIRDIITSPQKDNSNHEKRQIKKSSNTELLKRLQDLFTNIKEMFNNVSDNVKNTTKIVNDSSTSCSKTAKHIDEFLRSEIKRQRTQLAKKMTEFNQKSYQYPDDSDTNSKWTLRFRQLQDGLTELLPGSKVYVRKTALDKLKKQFKPTITARMLTKEIFSDYAISVCTLAGGKGAGGIVKNPGLDEYSVIVLMMYMEEYAKEGGWDFVEKEIKASLRSLLVRHRAKPTNK